MIYKAPESELTESGQCLHLKLQPYGVLQIPTMYIVTHFWCLRCLVSFSPPTTSPAPATAGASFMQMQLAVCCILQVVLVEFGGPVFATSSLPFDIWMWCLVFGVGELAWGQVCGVYSHNTAWSIKRKPPSFVTK